MNHARATTPADLAHRAADLPVPLRGYINADGTVDLVEGDRTVTCEDVPGAQAFAGRWHRLLVIAR